MPVILQAMRRPPRRLTRWVPFSAAPAPHTAALAFPLETDSPQSLQFPLAVVAVTAPTETATSQTVSVAPRSRLVTAPLTPETAQPVSLTLLRLATQTPTTELAQPIRRVPLIRLVTLLQETDAARTVSRTVRDTGQVTETDTAQGIFVAPRSRLVTQVTDTETANTIGRHLLSDILAQVTSLQTAQALTWAPLARLVTQVTDTGTALAVAQLIPVGTTPHSQRLTDDLGVGWYLYPDGLGGVTLAPVSPGGTTIDVGTGLMLQAVDGTQYRLGVSSTGSIELTVVGTAAANLLTFCVVRDSSDQDWYLWIEDGQLTLSLTAPTGGGYVLLLTPPTETATALAVVRPAIGNVTLPQASATETAQAVVWSPLRRLVAQSTASETAQNILRRLITQALTQVLSTNTAQGLAGTALARLVAVGMEQDTALGMAVLLLPVVVPPPPAPRPLEERHWADELLLTLQRREPTYGEPVAEWTVVTSTVMTAIDDDSVHERWDDTVVGNDLTRVGYRLASSQQRTRASMRLALTQPRTTPHTIAGLFGLMLGQVTSEQQPLLTAYRHTLRLAPPTQLPSISAQLGHQHNLYTIYPGVKAEECTLESNGAYLQLRCGLVGSGAHIATVPTLRDVTVVTSGLPPTSHRITDELGQPWYLSPDGSGGVVLGTVPAFGSTLAVGAGVRLLANDGTRYQVGVLSNGTITVTAVSVEGIPRLEAFALRDGTDGVWYFWVEAGTLVLSQAPPAEPPARLDEPWLRWGNSRLYLADVTEVPLVLGPPVQGTSTLGPTAMDISNRVLHVALQGLNEFLTNDAYRVGGGNVRSNFHATRQSLTLSVTLQVRSADEARDLATYLDQRHLAFEWQCLHDALDSVTITAPPASTLPCYHHLTDSQGGTWYFFLAPGGEPTLSPVRPAGAGVDVGAGQLLLGLDGWQTRLSVTPQGELFLAQSTFVGIPGAVEVCALQTSTGQPWYLWITATGDLALATSPPTPATLLTAGTAHASWWQVLDSAATPWYLSVDTLGELVLASTPPAGIGVQQGLGLELQAIDGWRYRVGVDVLGEVVLTPTTFVGETPHVLELALLLDPDGQTWYLWMDSLGGYGLSRSLVSVPTAWRMGVIVRCPHLQWRALVRTQQQEFDVLELTGTLLEDIPGEPIEVSVYNRQPGYLQPA